MNRFGRQRDTYAQNLFQYTRNPLVLYLLTEKGLGNNTVKISFLDEETEVHHGQEVCQNRTTRFGAELGLEFRSPNSQSLVLFTAQCCFCKE